MFTEKLWKEVFNKLFISHTYFMKNQSFVFNLTYPMKKKKDKLLILSRMTFLIIINTGSSF